MRMAKSGLSAIGAKRPAIRYDRLGANGESNIDAISSFAAIKLR
ncbi:hypothetical protein [Azospirillum melinis]